MLPWLSYIPYVNFCCSVTHRQFWTKIKDHGKWKIDYEIKIEYTAQNNSCKQIALPSWPRCSAPEREPIDRWTYKRMTPGRPCPVQTLAFGCTSSDDQIPAEWGDRCEEDDKWENWESIRNFNFMLIPPPSLPLSFVSTLLYQPDYTAQK